jgi:3-oxoacyl-[acyl-carrier-protein] synthase II
MALHRVVITGLGLQSPLGSLVGNDACNDADNHANSFFTRLCAGETGIRQHPNPEIDFPVGWVEFDATAHFGRMQINQLDRVSLLSIVAARQAIAMAGFKTAQSATALDTFTEHDKLNHLNTDDTAVLFGTGMGGAESTELAYAKFFDAPPEVWARKKTLSIPAAMTHAPASQIALDLGIRGECQTYSTACSSAAVAIGEAFRRIQHGYLTTAIAGGAECLLVPGVLDSWAAMKVLCETPSDGLKTAELLGTGCHPFSANRTGFAIGEAAGVLVLESLDAATARGATIIAELVGYGVSNDATHITKPNPAGQALAMRRAIACAGIVPADIGYINAHGTATGAGDVAETQSIKAVFGDHAYQLAVSSTKSAHGHCMGGTAAVEFIATVLALQQQIIPPTTHYGEPDADCDLDYVPHRGRTVPADKPLRYAASNAFAFGGNNAVLIAKRWEGV